MYIAYNDRVQMYMNNKSMICPTCSKTLKYYDSVLRIVRTKARETRWIKIQRLRCDQCKTTRRLLPDYIFPYKQYNAEVIRGVIQNLITSDTIGYEDYPCEMTMMRWQKQKESLKN